MNKKILIGLSALGVAAGFWACGDGSVEAKVDIDNYAMASIVPMEGDSSNMDLLNQLKNQALSDCEADSVPGGCRDKMNGEKDKAAAETPDQATEDSSGSNTTNNTPGQTGPVTPSTPGNTTTSSASTSPTTTSSAAATTTTDPSIPDGTCAANVSSVQEGVGTVTWTFTPKVLQGEVTDMLNYKTFVEGSTCNWTLEGATPATASGKCGSDAKTVSATYATGGKSYSASIKLGEKTIPCGSVRVNGKPITGCSCKSAGNVDIATNPTGSWTVDCTGSNDPITGYKWSGATGSGATGTYKFTKAKQEVSPKVTVSTAKTDTTLTCPAPKVTDSNNPETNISLPYSNSRTALQAGTIYNITYTDNRGSLVCFGSGTVACGTSDPVTVATWGVKIGSYDECAVVTVSDGASVECANTW